MFWKADFKFLILDGNSLSQIHQRFKLLLNIYQDFDLQFFFFLMFINLELESELLRGSPKFSRKFNFLFFVRRRFNLSISRFIGISAFKLIRENFNFQHLNRFTVEIFLVYHKPEIDHSTP